MAGIAGSAPVLGARRKLAPGLFSVVGTTGMRDDHLMQEKIEVSLERRHVALLAAGALVLLGGVFALGVLVGRQVASSALAGPQKPATGDLSALDAERDDAPAHPKASPPARTPPHAAPAPSRVDPARVDPPAPAAAPVAAASVSGAAAASPPAPAPAASGAMVVVPPAKVASIPAPRPTAKPGATLALAPPPKDLGRFTVQLGSSQDRAEAQRLESRARAAGLRSYVIETNLGAKGVWYRVRVGAFESRDAADRFRKDVERELRASAAVMPSR